MTALYIGIDPGVSGGIAALTAAGDVSYLAPLAKLTERDILDALATLNPLVGHAKAVLEFVRSSPQMGVKSAFTFGQNYGGLRMALIAAGVPFDEVTPQKWQTAMQCRTGGDKKLSRTRCQMLFPQVKATNWNADALVLAEFCRRQDRQGETA